LVFVVLEQFAEQWVLQQRETEASYVSIFYQEKSVGSSELLCAMLQCCAAAFIENLNAESLSIRAEDFDRYMSGAATPHDPSQVMAN